MQTFFFIIFGVAIVGLLAYIVSKLPRAGQDQSQQITLQLMDGVRKEMQERLDRMFDHMVKHQNDSSETIRKQFGQSANIIKEVTEKLTKLDETNKQVVGFAEQMKSLENILKNPKQRGILGEYILEALLGNVLQPQQYKMQYKFKNGEIVDSVVFFNDKVIPIDAKFSLEKYNKMVEEKDQKRREQLENDFKRDVKNRIDETAKYIRPAEDTTEFAFMFIPAEGIYYNLLIYNVGTVEINTHDLIEYAFRKHVIIVSPTSFFAYLETVLQGLKALKMEQSVKEIIKKVGELDRHLGSYEEYMNKLGKHLGTTVNTYNDAAKEFKKIDKDVYRITDGEQGGSREPLQIEKPVVGQV